MPALALREKAGIVTERCRCCCCRKLDVDELAQRQVAALSSSWLSLQASQQQAAERPAPLLHPARPDGTVQVLASAGRLARVWGTHSHAATHERSTDAIWLSPFCVRSRNTGQVKIDAASGPVANIMKNVRGSGCTENDTPANACVGNRRFFFPSGNRTCLLTWRENLQLKAPSKPHTGI
jgi:hypothetical protein